MDDEIISAVIYGLACGIGAGALKWCYTFVYRRLLSLFGERLLIE